VATLYAMQTVIHSSEVPSYVVEYVTSWQLSNHGHRQERLCLHSSCLSEVPWNKHLLLQRHTLIQTATLLAGTCISSLSDVVHGTHPQQSPQSPAYPDLNPLVMAQLSQSLQVVANQLYLAACRLQSSISMCAGCSKQLMHTSLSLKVFHGSLQDLFPRYGSDYNTHKQLRLQQQRV